MADQSGGKGMGVPRQRGHRLDQVDVVAGHLHFSHQRVARGHRIQKSRATARAGRGPPTRSRHIADDEQYYAAIAANPQARAVKLADNTADWRVAQLDAPTRERLAVKYAKARTALGV